MASMKCLVYITVLVSLFAQIFGLISMRYDVPTNLNNHALSLCPCSLGDHCNTTVIVPMMESSSSREWFPVSSSTFQSSVSRALQCGDQQLHLTISEGSFAIVVTGELLHVHSKLILFNTSFCLKRSFSEDYVIKENQTMQQVMLEAEICMTPPEMSLCCPSGSSLSRFTPSNTGSNNTLSCVPAEAPSLVLPISFDGSSHKWPEEGHVQGFPTCHQNLSTVPVNANQPGFGYLQLVQGRLQFRWQPSPTQKMIIVDSSQYCIGQERGYRSMRPVAALCLLEHKSEKYCQTTACFGKCCPDDQVYDLDLNQCVTSSFIFSWTPFREADDDYRVVYGMPSCESFFAISALDPEDPFRLLGNGSLHIDSWSRAVSVPEYCFDIFRNQTHSVPMALVCFGDNLSKPRDHLEDESTVLYILSLVLLISAAHLVISIASYLCTVRRENLENTTTTNKETQVCSKLNIFQWLICAFISFSAFQILLVSLLQFMYQILNQPICSLIALAAEWAALVTSGYIVALWLQLALRLQELRVWQLVLLFIAPPLLATLVALVAFFTTSLGPETCDINAAFSDPWAAWPITTVNVVLPLIGFAGLSLPLCLRRYALSMKAMARQQHLCCNAGSTDENIGGGVSTELRLENNRWWLLLKLDCVLLASVLSYLLVWQRDAVAFWAFEDVVLTLKGNVMASCLWIYLSKHCKRNR